MNRKTTRLIVLAGLVLTAGLAACKNDGQSKASNASGGVGAGPYTEWTPITPPSKQPK